MNDDFERLPETTADLAQERLARLRALFPECVTEGPGGPAVDFDLLRRALSPEKVVEGPQERYRLEWPGKRAALYAANAPTASTLRPVRERSKDFDATRNLYVEGDNLEALKLLRTAYSGKVKLIYIDPPYNTGHALQHRPRLHLPRHLRPLRPRRAGQGRPPGRRGPPNRGQRPLPEERRDQRPLPLRLAHHDASPSSPRPRPPRRRRRDLHLHRRQRAGQPQAPL